MQTPAFLMARGLHLRELRDEDMRWLRDLYASSRADEMASVPWPDTIRRDFLDQQFALQHRHYMAHFSGADFLAIEHREQGPIGRYYLQRTAPEHLIVDICLFPGSRGNGVGSALIRDSQREAATQGHGMYLHVKGHNTAARRLYERLGFRGEGEPGSHQLMRWRPTASIEDRLV